MNSVSDRLISGRRFRVLNVVDNGLGFTSMVERYSRVAGTLQPVDESRGFLFGFLLSNLVRTGIPFSKHAIDMQRNRRFHILWLFLEFAKQVF